MPKLSINLLTFNGEKYIDACLESVRCQTFRDFQIIVIDNGSKDRTREKIEQWEKIFVSEEINFKKIYNEKNVGFAEGHNIGFREIFDKFQNPSFKFQNNNPNFTHPLAPSQEGEGLQYVCCLNQDAILRPDYLEKLVCFMDAHPECGAASGKLLRIMDDNLFNEVMESRNTLKHPIAPSPASAKAAVGKQEGGNSVLSPIDYAKLATECNIIDNVGIRVLKSNRALEIGQSEQDKGQYDEIKEVFGVPGTLPVFRVEALEDIKIPIGKDAINRVSMARQTGDRDAKSCVSVVTEDSSSVQRNPHLTSPLQREGYLKESFEYFDKDFGSYKDDVDTAFRLRWRSWKIFVVPEAVSYHKRGARQKSTKLGDFVAAFNRKNKKKYINYLSQRNHIWMLVKNADKLNFPTFWYEAKKFGYEMLFEWSTFKAWIDIWKKMALMREKRKWIMGNKKISVEEMSKWFES